MLAFPPPSVAQQGIGALLRDALGSDPDPDFEAITHAAARLLSTPLSLVTLADGDRLWFKASTEGQRSPIALEGSFCREVIAGGEPVMIADTAQDSRFAEGALVRTEGLRFYAGVPIRAMGLPVGSLCVIDRQPRVPGEDALAVLSGLARVAGSLMDARLAAADARRDADALQGALTLSQRLHRQLQQAERMAQMGSWQLTLDSGALEWSDEVYRIHDLPVGAGHALEDALAFYPGESRLRIEQAVQHAIATGAAYDLELDFITAQGRARRVRSMGEVEMRDGTPAGLIGVFQDVTERHQLQQALQRAADTDELTRIAGRRPFNRHLDAMIAEAKGTGAPLAIALIDLDHFKAVNDRLGHAAGDDVLRRAAAALAAPWLRASFAARLGGDEFVLVLSDPGLLAQLDETVARLLADLVLPTTGPDGSVTVTATIGLCRIDGGATTREAALRCADTALYRAKAHARGTAAFADNATPMAR